MLDGGPISQALGNREYRILGSHVAYSEPKGKEGARLGGRPRHSRMRAALWQVRHAQVDDGRPRQIEALVPERALVDPCQIGGVACGLMGGRRRHERYQVVEA